MDDFPDHEVCPLPLMLDAIDAIRHSVLHGDRIAAIMVCDELEQRLLQDAAMFERYYRLEMQSAESLHQ